MNEYKTIVRKKDFSTMILLCGQCHHEIEVTKYEEQKCDWCGGDMVIIGKGTTWPSIEEYKIIAKKIRNAESPKKVYVNYNAKNKD